MPIIFKPQKHEYISTDEPDIDWISVTKVVAMLKQPFDGDAIALKSSKSKKGSWYGIPPEEIKQIWKNESNRAIGLGNWYHDEREKDLCGLNTIDKNGFSLSVYKPSFDEAGNKIAPCQKLDVGLYPEHMVYLKSVGIIGQSDKVEVYKDFKSQNTYVDITDYKTNKEIKTESFKSWNGDSQKMKYPVSHLEDCHLYHYQLQLSIYLYIILKHNPTYKPGKLTVHHVTFEESGRDKYDYPITKLDSHGNPIVKDIIPYEMGYLKTEVVSLMYWLQDNKKSFLKKAA